MTTALEIKAQSTAASRQWLDDIYKLKLTIKTENQFLNSDIFCIFSLHLCLQ